MTRIENIPHILKIGITHYKLVNDNSSFVPIGDTSLIVARNVFDLKNGRLLGEYIPFYFGTRTPMLYVVQNGFNLVSPISSEKIVNCLSSVKKIMNLQLDSVFTDGHAVDSFSSLYTFADIQNIDNTMYSEAIRAKYWRDEDDLDMKRRKEAEFLVLGGISTDAILGYILLTTKGQRTK